MGIYVWGTGCGASELIGQGLEPERITAFVDSYPSGEAFLGRPVLLPGALDLAQIDLLIVTARHTEAIAAKCRELGIPTEKLLFLKNNWRLLDRNDGCTRARELLGDELLDRLLPRQRVIPTPAQLRSGRLPEGELTNDYVRLGTLELLCRRLDDVPGAAAELGVYRGAFARCINRLLDRPLYLFDSFESFAADAPATEAFRAAHANTAMEQVLAAMPFPERVIMKPGFFPASLNGLEERFCLVSLDVDFYETTLEGLAYFWPRLSSGGYLLLHDWGSPELDGVARALADFEARWGSKLPMVPLCDVGGTMVLCKV